MGKWITNWKQFSVRKRGSLISHRSEQNPNFVDIMHVKNAKIVCFSYIIHSLTVKMKAKEFFRKRELRGQHSHDTHYLSVWLLNIEQNSNSNDICLRQPRQQHKNERLGQGFLIYLDMEYPCCISLFPVANQNMISLRGPWVGWCKSGIVCGILQHMTRYIGSSRSMRPTRHQLWMRLECGTMFKLSVKLAN